MVIGLLFLNTQTLISTIFTYVSYLMKAPQLQNCGMSTQFVSFKNKNTSNDWVIKSLPVCILAHKNKFSAAALCFCKPLCFSYWTTETCWMSFSNIYQ